VRAARFDQRNLCAVHIACQVRRVGEAVLGAERSARLADTVLGIDTTADVANLMWLAGG
jgi:hypothetical protein